MTSSAALLIASAMTGSKPYSLLTSAAAFFSTPKAYWRDARENQQKLAPGRVQLNTREIEEKETIKLSIRANCKAKAFLILKLT